MSFALFLVLISTPKNEGDTSVTESLLVAECAVFSGYSYVVLKLGRDSACALAGMLLEEVGESVSLSSFRQVRRL